MTIMGVGTAKFYLCFCCVLQDVSTMTLHSVGPFACVSGNVLHLRYRRPHVNNCPAIWQMNFSANKDS